MTKSSTGKRFLKLLQDNKCNQSVVVPVKKYNEPLNIHVTDLKLFMECPRRFYYEKILRIKKKGYKKPEYFDFGTEGHRVLSAHYATYLTHYDGMNVEQTIDSIENPMFKNHCQTLYKIYLNEYGMNENFQVLSIENEYSLPLTDQVNLIFTLDLMGIDNSSKNPEDFIMDHKFYSKFPDELGLELDFQASAYLWGASQLGYEPAYFLMNVIRKTPPMYPAVLQRGGLSTSKQTLEETDYSLYLESVHGIGADERDYKEQLDFLKRRGSNSVKRYKTSRSKKELDWLGNHLKSLADEITAIHNEFRPHYNRHCFGIPNQGIHECPFNFLCKLKQSGGNHDLEIRMSFENKEKDER